MACGFESRPGHIRFAQIKKTRNFGRLAQWLECLLYTQKVIGSNPMPPTKEVIMEKYKPTALAGVGIIINKDWKVLLIKRRGSHGAGTWAPPGGHIDYGESVKACAKREVREETGIEIKNLRIIGFIEDIFKKDKKHYITIWVKADWKSGEISQNHEEFSEIGWFSWKKLPKPRTLFFEHYLEGRILP
ncbi:MAG: NUDIX hydrolase [Parcubacteria group bacterium GW2011_GWA2_47_9]|nr:MAG: NUDIX hydrolase [Parcubacteria group bacterium GW2011_GWA2_47_9]